MGRQNFYTGKSGMNRYVSMFGAGKCVRRTNVIQSVAIPEDRIEKTSVQEAEKVTESKPEMEQIQKKLATVNVRKGKRRIVLNLNKKDDEY